MTLVATLLFASLGDAQAPRKQARADLNRDADGHDAGLRAVCVPANPP